MNALSIDGDKVVGWGRHFQITPRGLYIDGDPSFEVCEQFGSVLRTFEAGIQFAIGDYVNYLEDRFSEMSSQILDATGWTEETVRVYSWTAKQVQKENRMIDRGLSFAHHMAVAALPAPQQMRWLSEAMPAEDHGPAWPVARLKAAIRAGGDVVPTAWFLLVKCTSASKRDALQKQLELDGLECRSMERRK